MSYSYKGLQKSLISLSGTPRPVQGHSDNVRIYTALFSLEVLAGLEKLVYAFMGIIVRYFYSYILTVISKQFIILAFH